ncbi:cysteine dioxygenase [Prauserella cavernicola]|uniref:Cysteine dioxygenase family protein n=1 Tax=Prauserella cavernicola TaxID=2800127 RepID=A0A934QMV0_9PSEU|nr:cysteine dioxygenase family protein [Prauserella cavernicola]MBK1782747.1 cysteine dioxygenase family protein [Prauserella cavernicola]
MSTTTADVDVHPALHAWLPHRQLHPEQPLWTPQQLRHLTESTARDLAAPLSELVRYVSEQRWWSRLALTRGVELWLLSWLPGQGTDPHDHGGAAGSFTVFTGTLDETYRYPGSPLRRAVRTTGSALGFGSGHAHQLRNVSDAPAVTVHAYSPPLVPTRQYESLNDIPAEIPPLPALDMPFSELLARTEEEGP